MIYTIGDLRKMIKDLPDDTEIGVAWYGDDPDIEASVSIPEISVEHREEGTELTVFVELNYWEDDPDDIEEDDPAVIKPDELRRDGIMHDDSLWE